MLEGQQTWFVNFVPLLKWMRMSNWTANVKEYPDVFLLFFVFADQNTSFVAFSTGLVSHWNVLIAEQMRTSCNLLIPYVAPMSRIVLRRRRSVMAKYDRSSRRRF